jgi:NLR family CARD domain-containing protein 3
VIDYRTLKLSDVDLLFVSTLASGATYKSRMNPDRQLIRFQFLEILVRLAIEKFFKSSVCKTFDQAVIKFFEDHALPYFKQFTFQDFRDKKIWTEGMDNLVKKNMNVLRDIYRKFSCREIMPNEEPNLSIQEFIDLITATKVVDEAFGAREIGVIYNIAMITQVDEINKDRHTRMQFAEFVEAVCRVADRTITSITANNEADDASSARSLALASQASLTL